MTDHNDFVCILSRIAEQGRRFNEAIEKMSVSDGSAQTAFDLIHNVFGNLDTWRETEATMIEMQELGDIEGLTIVNGHIAEPIRPRLTEARLAHQAELEQRVQSIIAQEQGKQ